MTFLGLSHSFIEILFLDISNVLPALFFKGIFIIRPFDPFELASQRIQLNSGFELFFFNKAGLLEDSIKGLLPGILIKPLVLRHIVVVHLFVDDILRDIV